MPAIAYIEEALPLYSTLDMSNIKKAPLVLHQTKLDDDRAWHFLNTFVHDPSNIKLGYKQEKYNLFM